MPTPLLYYVAGALVLLLGLAVVIAVRRALGLRLLGDRQLRLVDPAEISADARELLEGAGRKLEAIGFAPFCAMRAEPAIEGGSEPEWLLIYEHAETASIAAITRAQNPSRVVPCDVSFANYSEDGTVLETVAYRGYLFPDDLPRHLLSDARTLSWEEQWQHHLAERSRHGNLRIRRLSPEALLERVRAFAAETLDWQVSAKQVQPCGDGYFRLGLAYAIALVVRSTRGERAREKAISRLEKASQQRQTEASKRGVAAVDEPPDDSDAILAADLASHRTRAETESRKSAGLARKLGLFAISVALFAVAFGVQLSLEFVAMLFGILLFHELGHAAAMRALGYRDLQILFVPFMGAVAAGKKLDAKPWEEIVVFLAGPLPGIVLGWSLIATGWTDDIAWLDQTVDLMLILNYLNLLPVVPLDGGRVMNLVLFDRFPRLQLLFTAASAAALGLGAFSLGDPVLWVFCALLSLGLPGQFAQSGVLKAVREQLRLAPTSQPRDEASVLRAIYGEMHRRRLDTWNSEQKYQFATQLVGRAWHPPASAGVVVASLLAYALCIAAPLGIFASDAVMEIVAASREHDRQVAEWDATIAAASTPEERARSLYEAGHFFHGLEVEENALDYLEQALDLLITQDQPETLADTHLLLGQIYPWWRDDGEPETSAAIVEQLREHLETALALREQSFGAVSPEVAEVLEAQRYGSWAEEPDQDSLRRVLEREERLIAILETMPPAEASREERLVSARHFAASQLQLLGRKDDAERQLVQALRVASAARTRDEGALQERALTQLSEFYFSNRHYAAARFLLGHRQRIADDLEADPWSTLAADWAWLAYWEGDYQDAGRRFAALREQANEQLPDFVDSGVVGLPYLLSQAATLQRSGDEAQALSLLEQAREVVEGDLSQPVERYFDLLSAPAAALSVPEEGLRRQAEQVRVLRPLLAKL